MSLCDVQARLCDHNPAYVRMFTWKQEGTVVKAIPSKPLSEAAHTVMRKAGFKFVSHNGECWYELVAQGEVVSGSPQAAHLRMAAKQWLGESE